METKTLKISKEVHKMVKLYCIENDINMYEFIEETLKEKINRLKHVNNTKSEI